MIANVTMQSCDGDCPSNIIVDVEKLKNLTIEDVDGDADDLQDAQRYVKIIEGEYNRLQNNKGKKHGDEGFLCPSDVESVPNPEGYEVLELAEVELPATIDFTDVIFYGSY